MARGDSPHAISGQIARGLFGRRASGVGPAVEERQPEPAASVAGCGPGRHGPGLGGEDRRDGPPDAVTGSIASTGRVWRASSTTGRKVPSLVFRRSNWLSSRRSSRRVRIVRRTGSCAGVGSTSNASLPKVRRRLSSALCREAAEETRLLPHQCATPSSGSG